MPASDFLKSMRSQGYKSSGASNPGGEQKDPGMPGTDEQDNSTPRAIKLTDDEQKIFASVNPGDELTCEVHGSLQKDGKFQVMSVAPMGNAPEGENEMAGQVAQRVMPNIVPSPS